MYNKTYSYYVNPAKRLFCSDAQGTPIATLPNLYFGERPVFTMTFDDGVLVEGEKLVFVMDNENRFLDSHSTTGLAPVMAWCVHEITAEDAQNKSIDLELYCFGRKYADVINGHDNAVTCILSLFIKSIDENLNCTFSTLATTLAYAEPTIVSPDCVFDELPIDMYLTRDEMNALIAEVEAIQREAIEKAEQARQSAAVAETAAQEASQIAQDLKPLKLDAPPTTSTSGSVGQLAVYHDADNNKNHTYHLCFVSEGESATLYHWEECVLVSQGNVAGGYPVLDVDGLITRSQLPLMATSKRGAAGLWPQGGVLISSGNLYLYSASNAHIDARVAGADNSMTINARSPIVPACLDYAVRSVLPNVTVIPAATSDYSLVDSSATTNNHSHVYSHAPSAAPTYRLPQVTDTTISHYIELTVDFTAVQTYSFLDYAGEPIVPLFTPAIAAGDVYTFKMEYSAIKAAWLIYPQKQGAVADDFVMRGEVGAANGVAGLNGNSLISTANIPMSVNYGTRSINGMIATASTLTVNISSRNDNYRPIVPSNLNYAVTAALTDSNHITLTDAQKATAQSVFGVGGPITAIPAATSAYTLAEGIFTHAPTNAPTYTLPSITDDIRTHKVVLIIDFSSVQTFSFLVDGGGDVTFQSYANPTMGDVWAFRCWWYGGKWRIMPMKIKNCVTRQLTNGALAITDAVAGDALALRMVASRSVVVNQLVQNGATFSFDFENTSTSTLYPYMPSPNAKVNFERILNHVYLAKAFVSFTSTDTCTFYFTSWQAFSLNSYNNYFAKVTNQTTITINDTLRVKGLAAGKHVTGTLSIMLVDLTQYFNGDQTLIDSIQSWDDLVAYDPRFAQYVEYNTGEVVGVTPAVSVNNGTAITSPNELFAVGNAADEFEAVAGVTTHKMASVDLGTLDWQYKEATNVHGLFYFGGVYAPSDARAPSSNEITIMGDKYISTPPRSFSDVTPPDKSIMMYISKALYVFDSAYTDAAAFKAAVSGVMLYYELATPTTSQSTPAQISLQAGNNTAMQTDGGRLAPIDITYESDEL